MSTLLTSIIAAALLSVTSLFTVIFRVSPLNAAEQALPAFFLSLFLSVASVATLLFAAMWHLLPTHTWDRGKQLSVALRQGLFCGLVTVILLLFHLLAILNWWIGILVCMVFILIEVALHQQS